MERVAAKDVLILGQKFTIISQVWEKLGEKIEERVPVYLYLFVFIFILAESKNCVIFLPPTSDSHQCEKNEGYHFDLFS